MGRQGARLHCRNRRGTRPKGRCDSRGAACSRALADNARCKSSRRIAAIMAVVYLWSGERDAAIDRIGRIASLPGSPTAGDLKLNPIWDELRNDPRFDKIIA